MKTIKACLQWGAKQLSHFDTPQLDSEVILGHVLGMTRTALYTYPDQIVDQACAHQYEQYIHKRAQGLPVALITGVKEFWSLPFYVTQDVLIPRDDTEILVEQALSLFAEDPIDVADLGTGSGAIACSLAHTRPQWRIIATDQSAKSLEVAQRNVMYLSLSNVTLLQGSWFEPLQDKRFDLIVSNPPYIDENDPNLLDKQMQWEPKTALISKDHGYHDIREIVNQARTHLQDKGWLMLEHGYQQGEQVQALMQQAGYINIKTIQDLAQHPRVTIGQYGI